MWKDVWPAFKRQGYKIITIDLPCHGDSRFDGEQCSMTQMAEGVYNILHTYNITRPIIIGHSMGGYVGLELLKLLDARLILLHSNFWEDPTEKKADRDRVINIVRKGSELFVREAIPGLFDPNNLAACMKDVDKLVSRALQIPAHEISAATAGMRDRKAAYELMNSKDVSIIHGENDPIITSSVLNTELEKLSKRPRVVTIPNCGHMSVWENRSALVEAINGLL